MTKADFAIVSFQEHLGDHKDDATFGGTTFVGDQTSEREFVIEGVPTGAGYLVLQLAGDAGALREILINGERIDRAAGLAVFPASLIKRGANKLQLKRADGDGRFAVHHVVVHWREREPISDAFRKILQGIEETPADPTP